MTLGIVSDATSQPVGVVFAAYFLGMGIYFAVDLAYVFLFELRASTTSCLPRQSATPRRGRGVRHAAMEARAAARLLRLRRGQRVRHRAAALDDDADLLTVAFRAFLLGWFAYGNLALVQAWSYRYFPLKLVGPLPLSGGALCAPRRR